MQVHDRIGALNDRAASLNLSLWRVCKSAGIDYSTVSRWRNSDCNPTILRFAEITQKIEQQLEKLEYDMAMKLIDRMNPEAAPRIAALLKTPNAGEPGAPSSPEMRDGRESTGTADGQPSPKLAGKPDRAA
jgi:hypothetical protein